MTKDCLQIKAEDRVEISTQVKFCLESTIQDKKISAKQQYIYCIIKNIVYKILMDIIHLKFYC